MELTGKCELDFDKWLKENNKDLVKLSDPSIYFSEIFSMSALFKYLTESMQYGVLVDFFGSVGIDVVDDIDSCANDFRYLSKVDFKYIDAHNTRPEARTAAIQKANELYNL
jgi:hypothetical protein